MLTRQIDTHSFPSIALVCPQHNYSQQDGRRAQPCSNMVQEPAMNTEWRQRRKEGMRRRRRRPTTPHLTVALVLSSLCWSRSHQSTNAYIIVNDSNAKARRAEIVTDLPTSLMTPLLDHHETNDEQNHEDERSDQVNGDGLTWLMENFQHPPSELLSAMKTPVLSESQYDKPEQVSPGPVLTPLEALCLSRMDQWYAKSQSAKCPFLRRRSGDLLDTVEAVLNHIVVRKECWQTPQAHRPAGSNKKLNTIKYKHLTPQQLYQCVLQDWIKGETGHKGYYVTGKLTTAMYRDDCLFLGPDPDMPIHGMRKYAGVASHLFDYDASEAVLTSLNVVPAQELPLVSLRQQEGQQSKTCKNCGGQDTCLVAEWTLSGILRLPWRPSLPTFSGQTIYHLDEDGLIVCHEESWDCSVLQAFCHTLLPDLANRVWRENVRDRNHKEKEEMATAMQERTKRQQGSLHP